MDASTDTYSDSEDGTIIKKPRMTDAPQKTKFSLKPGAVVALECVPADKLGEAIKHASTVPGIKASTHGSEDGIMMIMVDPGARFQKRTNCLDGDGWEMVKLASGDNPGITPFPAALLAKESPTKMSITGALWDKMLTRMDLTEDEKSNLPMFGSLLGAHGRNLIAQGRRPEKEVFLVLSYDHLVLLEYYGQNNRNPTRTMEALPTKANKMFLMNYTDIFGKTSLEDGSIILNPLNFRPSGDVVMVVNIDYIPDVLAHCTSPKAKAFRGLLCRSFTEAVREAAEKLVTELGPKEFEKTVAKPADAAMMTSFSDLRGLLLAKEDTISKMTVEALESDIRRRLVELDVKKKDVEIASIGRQKQLAILAAESAAATHEDHLTINKPIIGGHTHERMGCVVLKETEPSEKEKLAYARKHDREADTDQTKFMVCKYTSGGGSRKLSLSESYSQVSTRNGKYEEGPVVLALLGGIGVYHGKRIFRKAFEYFGNLEDTRRSTQLFYCDRGDDEDAAVEVISREFRESFAVGVYDGRRIFTNDKIMASLGDRDRKACERVVGRLAKHKLACNQLAE